MESSLRIRRGIEEQVMTRVYKWPEYKARFKAMLEGVGVGLFIKQA
jgi:hypothetical protein